jgi:hypothetical protein
MYEKSFPIKDLNTPSIFLKAHVSTFETIFDLGQIRFQNHVRKWIYGKNTTGDRYRSNCTSK